MALAIVTGSGGLIGSESVRRLVESGWDVVGLENDMRARFFGPEASTAARHRGAGRRLSRVRRDRGRHPRRGHGQPRLQRARPEARAGRTHGGAALSRLGRPRASHGLLGQRRRHAQPAGGGPADQCPEATFVFTSTNKVYGDPPNFLPLAGRERAGSCRRTIRLVNGIDDVDVDRPLHALALRRLEGRGRRPGAGVRPLLRHADGVLSRRLPDRARITPAPSCTGSSRT